MPQCIGEAAGHIGVDRPYAELFPPANASLLRALYPHAPLPGARPPRPAPAKAAPPVAAHGHADAARGRDAPTHPRARGRVQALTSRGPADHSAGSEGPAGPHQEARTAQGGEGKGRGREIDALEREMARSLRTLNAKLDAIDTPPRISAGPRTARPECAGSTLALAAAMAAVVAAAGARQLA